MEWAFRAGVVLLGKYRVESIVGRGGMGMVLRVTHLQLGEPLAIKVMLPEAAASSEGHARFLREAQSVVRLRGEHVARVIDIGILPETGAPYIVMEYLRGVDLASEVARRRILPPGEAVDYVLQACEGLSEAHANGIVHRDIKPANLFLTTRPDGTPLVKVLDFGISKGPVTGGTLTRTDSVLGTPGYMSPEQMKSSKEVDARTDVWALGIILYECLTGRRPWDAEAFSAIVLMAATEAPPPMDRRIPRGLQGVVLRCLEKDRDDRFPSVAALAAALAPFARDQRAAGLTVDRANLMARGTGPGVSEHAGGSVQSPTATTLSGSAGVSQSRTKRRSFAIAGATVLAASIAVLSAVQLTGRLRSNGSSGVAADGETLDPAATGTTPDTGAVVVEPVSPEQSQKAMKCATLQAQKDWKALEDCADALERLGGTDKARQFRARAKQEHVNEFYASQLRQELGGDSLRKAQAWLNKIDKDSVYFVELSDALDRVEALQIEEVGRKAQSYARIQSCATLKKYADQLLATSTEKVAAVAQAVPCGRGAPQLSGYRVTPPSSKNGCGSLNIDETMADAASKYRAGRAGEALALATRALECRQDFWMYQTAVVYACSAHNATSAQLHYSKLLAEKSFANTELANLLKGNVAKRCEEQKISLQDASVESSSQPQRAAAPATPPAAGKAPATRSATAVAPIPDAPSAAGSATATASPPPSTAENPCDTMNVEDVMAEAGEKHRTGYDKAALALVVKALRCKQDSRMYRLAVVYACAAHDLASAKLYFAKVPPANQANLEQYCQPSEHNVRAP